MEQSKQIAVEVISGCYTGRQGVVVNSTYIPDLQQQLYTIRTNDNEVIHCPANELEIKS